MTKHEADVIGGLNMTDQISNEAYKQIMIAAQDENEPCEDCISRQAVLDSIHANCVYENEYNLTAKHIEDAVKQLPPVSPQKPKSEWEHDHEILKAYSDGANAVLESIKYLIEQYEHYLELLDADMKDGSATIVTKTKYAVYTEVVKQLKEVLESEEQE